MSENVSIDLWFLDDSGPTKAIATVTLETELGELSIARFKVIQKEGKQPWVAFPNIRYQDENTKEWKNIEIFIECRKFKNNLSKMILEKYAELV